ncbi:hypothetical protein FRB93_013815 [Tulasnella sp. JGI-2019a]|nr:hypothetical protein FRB93_013815 [Tulasnella sp. JGI-2019a]
MKTLMRTVVSDLYQEPDPNDGMYVPNPLSIIYIKANGIHPRSRGASAGAAIANVLTGLFSTGVPIAPLVIGGVMLLKWLYNVYSQTPGIIRVLMAYIIDLTAILEGLHHLIQPRPGDNAEPQTLPLSGELILATVDAYNTSMKA